MFLDPYYKNSTQLQINEIDMLKDNYLRVKQLIKRVKIFRNTIPEEWYILFFYSTSLRIRVHLDVYMLTFEQYGGKHEWKKNPTKWNVFLWFLIALQKFSLIETSLLSAEGCQFWFVVRIHIHSERNIPTNELLFSIFIIPLWEASLQPYT